MVKSEIVQFFETHCDERGIPSVKYVDWKNLISQYEKNDIRDSLAEYITANNIPFPLKQISEEKLKTLFQKFRKTSMLSQYKEFDIVEERYEYVNKYSDRPLGVIDKSHVFNNVSDYFQQENRMKCGSNSCSAPLEIWSDKEKLKTMNWHFWRAGVMNNTDLTEKSFRGAFRLGTYTATQFKPSVAKALYEKHNAVNVLDTSCGWGDRLAGFYATDSTKLYVGCDPNPEVFEVYKQQCLFYEQMISNERPRLIEKENYFECIGSKTVIIWRLPSEDVDWSLYENLFDFYFTSPPYFETEKYASNTDKVNEQSWSRYSSFETWKNDFFFKTTESVWSTIKKDGFMMINIIEPRSKHGKRLNLCDDMVSHFQTLDSCHYIGKIGMRMMARPNATELKSVFIEPIWVFRKNSSQYLTKSTTSLEDFFV